MHHLNLNKMLILIIDERVYKKKLCNIFYYIHLSKKINIELSYWIIKCCQGNRNIGIHNNNIQFAFRELLCIS